MGYRPGFDLGPVRVGIESLTVGGSLGVEMLFYLSGFVLFLPYAHAMLEGTALPTLGHFPNAAKKCARHRAADRVARSGEAAKERNLRLSNRFSMVDEAL